MDPNQLLQNQNQVVPPYEQLGFTPVQAQIFNTFDHPQTSTNQAFTNYNNVATPAVATWQSSTTSAAATPILMARLLQKYPSVFAALSEAEQKSLNEEQKVKVLSEEIRILEEKVRELEKMNRLKDNKIRCLEIGNSLGMKMCRQSTVDRINHQLKKSHKIIAAKEIELLNQPETAKKIEIFRIERIRTTFPDGVDPNGERMRQLWIPPTKAEEEEKLAQIESKEKSATTNEEATVSASTSITTFPSSSSSSARLEAIGKDSQKHGFCSRSRGHGQMCLCGARFSQRGNLITHIQKKRKGGGKFSGKRFDGTGNLGSRVRKDHKHNLRFSRGCRLCGQTFGSYLELYEHRKYEHGTTKSAAKAKVSETSGGKGEF